MGACCQVYVVHPVGAGDVARADVLVHLVVLEHLKERRGVIVNSGNEEAENGGGDGGYEAK